MKGKKILFLAGSGLWPVLGWFVLGLFILYFPFKLFLESSFPVFFLVILAVVFVSGLAFLSYFYRDPERIPDAGEETLVSPADGRIIELLPEVQVNDLGDFSGRYKKVSIFMAVSDVHVNRAPMSGTIKHISYRRGEFFPADKSEASLKNESNTVCIEDEKAGFRIIVKQISGILARRIVCWVKSGDVVQKGERFGMIMFGSRVELSVPPDFEFTVKPGDRVRAGETVIGRKS